VESSVASADSRLQMDRSLFKSTVEHQRTYVTDTVDRFTESLHQVDDQLQLHSKDADHFLSVELKQDMPTGTFSLFASQLAGLILKDLSRFIMISYCNFLPLVAVFGFQIGVWGELYFYVSNKPGVLKTRVLVFRCLKTQFSKSQSWCRS